MTLYQKYRRYKSGARKYIAIKGGKEKYVYAESLAHAQTKFLMWHIYRAPTFFERIRDTICHTSIKRFYWQLTWLNSITWEHGNPKIYRWGYWNFKLRGRK